ncbi:MAG: hypothetical protein DSY33_00865 [Archaeoglobus sp.]|nr:MAG: hypothetical protein DSY33_00865 [Archaeoglobus sp.]
MLNVKIRTSIPEYCIVKKYPNAVLKLRCVCRGEKGIKALVNLKTSDRKTVIVIDEHRCPLAQKILNSGAIVSSAEIHKDIIWNVVCNNDTLKNLMNELEKSKVNYELISKEKFSGDDEITYKEYVLLKLAFESGFFDSPKKIKLEEIAETLNISKSTASETLRRGLRKVLKLFFKL